MKILITGGDGYVGSVLHRHLVTSDHAVWSVDPRAGDGLSTRRYQHIEPHQLASFDTIIHLAAHSSVAACEANPSDAIDNNLLDVIALARSLTTQRLIFASTGSVYDMNAAMLYDATKRAAEKILPYVYAETYVVRFGTVCGVSPVMREDLILNGMTRDAMLGGVITVRNPGAWRPVLFFPDLCYAMEQLVTGNARPGIYNLASFQARIGSWAEMVAQITGARIEDDGITQHYDFRMPILPKSLTTANEVIGELVGYWKEHA